METEKEALGRPEVTGLAVAVAVKDLSEAVTRYREAFGLGEPSYARSEADAVEVAVQVARMPRDIGASVGVNETVTGPD